MLKIIITHITCVVMGYVIGNIFPLMSWIGPKAVEDVGERELCSVKKKVERKEPIQQKVVSEQRSPKGEKRSQSGKQGTMQKVPKNQKEGSSLERSQCKATTNKERNKQVEDISKLATEQSEKKTTASAKLESKTTSHVKRTVPICASKTIKFKRLSQIKEVEIEVNLELNEVFNKVEKAFGLDMDTKVTRLMWKGRLLKEGFLNKIPDYSVVSVMVRKAKPASTKPADTKSKTKNPKKVDGLDFLDSVLDGLKEPPKVSVQNKQLSSQIQPTRTRNTKSKMSISDQKRIQHQLNKDIVMMEKRGWTRGNHGLSRIYHQDLAASLVRR